MITKQRANWWRMLFIWKGSVLKKIIKQLSIIAALSLIVLYFNGRIYEYKVPLNPTIFTLIGLALAIFMGFCNTASYDRFWEGRKLWGSLVIEARSLNRQVLTLIHDDSPEFQEEKINFVKKIAAFTWALNYQLRNSEQEENLPRLLNEKDYNFIKDKKHKPVILLDLMGKWVNVQYNKERIDSIILASINQQLNQLSQVVGGCERIANTPLPFPYSVLLHRTVYSYCFLLPFGLVDSLGWMMPIVVILISYTFIALDALIQEIEEPFGLEENDLPLNMLSENIEYSLFEQAEIPQEKIITKEHYVIY